MRKLIAACVLLLAGSAWADGAPIITAAKTLPANEAQVRQWKSRPEVVSVQPIKIDKLAFGANIITMELGGKQRRFVGSLGKPHDGFQSWAGSDGSVLQGGALLSLTRTPEGEVLINVTTATRQYETRSVRGGQRFLVEINPTHVPRPETFPITKEEKQ